MSNPSSIQLAVSALCDPASGAMTGAQVESIISKHCVGRDQIESVMQANERAVTIRFNEQLNVLYRQIDALKAKIVGGVVEPKDMREVED